MRFDSISRIFHWVTTIVVVVAFVLGPGGFGRLMHQGVDPATRFDIVWHESLGALVLVLTLLRLLWLAMRPATPEVEMARWMRWGGQLMHIALWGLSLPLTALLAPGSEGHPLTLLGGVRVNQLPLIAGSGIAGWTDWGDLHGLMGDAVMWLAGLHAAAALFHHFVLKDGVLTSMLPGSTKR